MLVYNPKVRRQSAIHTMKTKHRSRLQIPTWSETSISLKALLRLLNAWQSRNLFLVISKLVNPPSDQMKFQRHVWLESSLDQCLV